MFWVDPDACPVGCSFYGKRVSYKDLHLPNCERACDKESVWFTQNMMLGTKQDIDDIAAAVEKVVSNIDELKE